MSIGCVAGVAAVVLGVAGCSGGTPANPDVTAPSVRVVTSFYPLQFVAERVGGGLVAVENLTPPGAEPHDLELGANDLVSLREADLVVYLRGVATAVDDAVATAGAEQSLDVSEDARLEQFADADHAVLDDGHEDDHGRAALGVDTHFWLDPIRLADVADAVAARLGAIDPANAAAYATNAAALRADLVALDTEYAQGLRSCTSRDLVTSHAAFGYLATRYNLHQESVSGLSPDEEPTPAALARVADFVKSEGVTTIFTETLVSAAVARAIADETGVSTAVLDPLEGLTSDATGDYLTVMRANLATLRTGLGCS
jgi:zinc transport system substrate-binding protein